MSCCCQKSGLGELASVYGLRGLGALLAAGSRVRVGFAINYNLAQDDEITEAQGAGHIIGTLQNYLQDGVTFDRVNISVSMPSYWGMKDGYITVEATSRVELPYPEVFAEMVEYGIQTYLPGLRIDRRDTVRVDAVSPEAARNPNAAQSTSSQSGQQNPNPPGPKKECKWAELSFGNYIACQLGIDDAVGGVKAGATGAILGVAVITAVALVLLKR